MAVQGTDQPILVRGVRRRLPFRMSPQHWTRWQLNRGRTGYYARKVQVLRGQAGTPADAPKTHAAREADATC